MSIVLKAANAMYATKDFISFPQREAIKDFVYGEEGPFFAEKLVELQNIIGDMPKSYETDGQGEEAIAYLHYFKNGWDWYITEKDAEDDQQQAFGLVSGHEVELGYISIAELTAKGVEAELDLHWTPKTLREIKEELK